MNENGRHTFIRPLEEVYPHYIIACLAFLIMGIGSFLFHCTQQYWAELLDEVGLSIMAVAFLAPQFDLHPVVRGRKRFLLLGMAIAWAVIGCSIYFVTHNHEIWLTSFTVAIVFAVYLFYFSWCETLTARGDIFIALLVLISRGCWQVEQVRCDQWHLDVAPSLDLYETDLMYWMHPLFHCGCYVGCIYMLLNSARRREDQLKKTRSFLRKRVSDGPLLREMRRVMNSVPPLRSPHSSIEDMYALKVKQT